MDIQKMISEMIAGQKEDDGIKNVFFVACGGSCAALYPAKLLLEKEALNLRTGQYTSNEFVHNPPKALGKNSIVVLASHGGNTPETVSAAKLSHETGADVIALTWTKDAEISKFSDATVGYSWGEGKTISDEKIIQALKIAVEILNQTEGYPYYEQFMDGVHKIDRVVEKAKDKVKERAARFAEEHKDDKMIYTMGSGVGFGAAYMQAICIFMEMQWINAASIHTGEYFHGPFEVTDYNIPFMIQISEGPTRPLDERALKFLQQYARRVEVLDARELGLSVIDTSVAEYFNHSLFTNVYDVYNEALAGIRQHPLSVRRYMWKVQY